MSINTSSIKLNVFTWTNVAKLYAMNGVYFDTVSTMVREGRTQMRNSRSKQDLLTKKAHKAKTEDK